MPNKLFGGTTSTVSIPGPTAEERELTTIQTDLAREQLSLLKEQRVEQKEAFAFLSDELIKLNEQAAEVDPVFEEIKQIELERIRRGGAASPEELRLIQESTARAEEAGAEQISTFAREAQEQVRDVLAPGRGLRPTDRPIVERAETSGREAVRQQGQLATGLAQARSEAELNFPLASGRVLSEMGQFQQQLAESARNFQQELRQTAFENRLRLQSLSTQGNLGLLGIQPAGASALSALSKVRTATTTTKKTQQAGLFDLLKFAGQAAATGGTIFGA